MNKNLARIAELTKDATSDEGLALLSQDNLVKIILSVFIHETKEEERYRGGSKPFVTASTKPAVAPPQQTIPGLDNLTKDLTGKLEIKKETDKGSIICSVGGTEFWIFPSAATLMTNAKFWKGAEVGARVQERAFKDGKKYWMAIGLSLNPGDDIIFHKQVPLSP